MNRKIFSIAVVALLLEFTTSADPQQSKKVPVVGVLWGSSPDGEKNLRTGFQRGLQELRYVEGKNILVEDRYADGKLDRSPSLAAELVQLKVDVIVVSFLPGARALKEATKTIPIVMVSSVDPVAAGLIDSLARPGGNVTGVALLRRDLSGKRLELLKEIVPGRSHFGALWDANAPGPAIAFKEYDAAARALKIQFQSIEVRGPDPDLDGVSSRGEEPC